MIDCIERKVTAVQNEMLLCPITVEEVRKALFHMHPDKSPGPDGMSLEFYQKYWKIVGKDVVAVVKDFFDIGVFNQHLVHTNIPLVPKKRNPQTMTEIRPISLCNVIYKIISKVLANRLK